MVEAFASITDLQTRLKRTFSSAAEITWIEELLKDASTYLRSDVLGGMQVFPRDTHTVTLRPNLSGWIDLPQRPVVSVAEVTRDGEPIEFEPDGDSVQVRGSAPAAVTYTFGLAAAPDALIRWTCVLVSQVLVPLELKLGLTVGGLSSVQIDDFRAAFADAGEQTGIALSDRAINALRHQWAGGGFRVAEATR